MPRIPAALAVSAFLLAAACEKHATVIPKDPTSPPGTQTLSVAINSDRGSLDAGSPQPATLTVSAKYQDGTPAADGTDLTLNTSLGHFGVDADGKPVTLTTTKLTRGAATVAFYAGSEVGTANLLATVGTSVGRLNISIVAAPVAPVADFTVETAGLRAIFTDASTGSPTARSWNFGDGRTSTEVSPTHDYTTAGTYTVTLTVSNLGGSNSKSKFVTLVSPPLTAAFTYEVNGLNVLFTDTSTGNPTSWQWDFGDGKPFDTRQHPLYTYERAGTYIVFLTVRNASGESSTARQFITVGGNAPKADFTIQTAGLRANFTDTSTGNPTSWSWDFGDGSALETTQNATHTYTAAGTYNVTLTVTNSGGSSSKSQFVTVTLGTAPKAAFTFEVNGLDVIFTDASTNSPTAWDWDFGDGSAHVTTQNATHSYTTGGTYKVTLTVSNAAGESSVSTFVTVVGPPTADFEYRVLSTNTLTVNFSDLSTGSPTAWAWNFGDCTQTAMCTSTEQNPSHTYTAPGVYTVRLTASNTAGQNTRTQQVAAGAPQASFSCTKSALTVTCTDTSTNSPTVRSWNFGDCATNPNCTGSDATVSHTYLVAGTYSIRLTVANAGGQGSSIQSITVP